MKEQDRLFCLEILDFMQTNHGDKTKYFNGPAEDALLDPNMKIKYRTLIQNPRDFSQIRKKLKSNSYKNIAAFQEDVTLCLENCKLFCKDHYPDIANIAQNLQKLFKTQMRKTEKEIRALQAESDVAFSGGGGPSRNVSAIYLD